jgi:hypothetical protein
MSSQTHARSDFSRGRKVSQKKSHYRGGNRSNQNQISNEDEESANNNMENNNAGTYPTYEQAGGDLANVATYHLDGTVLGAGNSVPDAMITFTNGTNIQTITANGSALFTRQLPLGAAPGAAAVTTLNSAYDAQVPPAPPAQQYNPVNVDQTLPGAAPGAPALNTRAIGITGADRNNQLSAALMSELIKSGVLNKIDNIYLANDDRSGYLTADIDGTPNPDEENRLNTIILPFTVLKQNGRAANAVANIDAIADRYCIYLLSHYIGDGAKLMYNQISNNVEDNKFFHTSTQHPPVGGAGNHIAWRPFFCNYNHHTKILNGFINQSGLLAQVGAGYIDRTRISHETTPVAKNILYHVLESSCNPSNIIQGSIPLHHDTINPNHAIVIGPVLPYKQRVNNVLGALRPSPNLTDFNTDLIVNVAAPGNPHANTVGQPNVPAGHATHAGVPHGKAVSIEIYTPVNNNDFNNINSSEATAPDLRNPAANVSKLFPAGEKIMVISFMVDVNLANLPDQFPIVEYAEDGAYVFDHAAAPPPDGQVAWVPIAQIVPDPAAPPGVAPVQRTMCQKLDSSRGVPRADGNLCNAHNNPSPLAALNACQGMETPYEWFVNLVGGHQHLPKILKQDDGFKIDGGVGQLHAAP